MASRKLARRGAVPRLYWIVGLGVVVAGAVAVTAIAMQNTASNTIALTPGMTTASVSAGVATNVVFPQGATAASLSIDNNSLISNSIPNGPINVPSGTMTAGTHTLTASWNDAGGTNQSVTVTVTAS